MTFAMAAPNAGFGWLIDYEPATDGGRIIQNTWAKEQNYLRGSASDWLPIVEASLSAIRNDCLVENWDGSDAHPISDKTLNLAADIAKVLFKLVPTGTPVPDIIPEADGEICMSWSVDVYHLFSFSIGVHGKVNFAGQFGNSGSIHGWQPIDATSCDKLEKSLQETARQIQRLYENATSKRKR